MPFTTTTLVSHEQKSGSNAKGPWTVNKFKAQDGRQYDTFDKDLAARALERLNVPSVLEYEEVQKGQYTNYTLTGVAPADSDAAAAPSAPQTAAPAAGGEDDRQLRIMRQSALERAILTFNTAGQDPLTHQAELLELADQYIDYFVNGR